MGYGAAYLFAFLLREFALIETGCGADSGDGVIVVIVLLLGPFLVDVHLLHYFLDGGQLVNLYLQVAVVLIIGLVVQFRGYLAQPLIVILILLEDVHYELLPEVILIGDVDYAWRPIQLYSDFAGDEVEGVDVALVDHLGRVQEDVLLVAECLD